MALQSLDSNVFQLAFTQQADKNMHEAVLIARYNGKGVFLLWQDGASWADGFIVLPRQISWLSQGTWSVGLCE